MLVAVITKYVYSFNTSRHFYDGSCSLMVVYVRDRVWFVHLYREIIPEL